MASYLTDSYNMSIKPVLDFISPVITPIGNFFTSGESYDPDKSTTANLIQSFQTPTNLFEDNWMSDNMDLTFGGGDIPVASDYITTINDVHSHNTSNPAVIDYAS